MSPQEFEAVVALADEFGAFHPAESGDTEESTRCRFINRLRASLPTGDAGEPVAQDFHEKFGTTPADAATPTPKPMAGRWWLIAPDGSDFQGDSPIDCIKAEIASRVPAHVALARIADGLNEPDGDECPHSECDDEGTCYECGKAHCR